MTAATYANGQLTWRGNYRTREEMLRQRAEFSKWTEAQIPGVGMFVKQIDDAINAYDRDRERDAA